MKTLVVIAPFALFGNPGTQRGAELLGDAIREMIDDARAETRPTRSDAFAHDVLVVEIPLTTPDEVAKWNHEAGELARSGLDNYDLLLWIGGNHLSVAPLYEALGQRAGSCVLQFDAHLDIYNYDDTMDTPNHGNFIMHLPHRPPIVNVGHRDLFPLDKMIRQYFAADVPIGGDEEAARRILARAKTLAIDIDWDVIDPTYFPAVGDALPFGMQPHHLLAWLRSVWGSKVRAVSFSEFEPGRDQHDRSLQLAVWLVEQILLWKHEAPADERPPPPKAKNPRLRRA